MYEQSTEAVEDIALVTKAEALTWWFGQTGWLPERGSLLELKDFCASIIRNLEDDPAVHLYDLDHLLAIGAGISNGLQLAEQSELIVK